MRDWFVLRTMPGKLTCAVLSIAALLLFAMASGGCGGGASPEVSCNGGECPQSVGAGGRGGAGGAPLIECKQKADCAQPDPKCGSATCISGVCVPSIKAGPTASQLRGDCMRTECDESGQVVTVPDESDAYDDGRVCTVDRCTPSGSVNEMLPLNTKCPGEEGVCVNQWCLPCLSDWSCQDATLQCATAHKCVPDACFSAKVEPGETDVNCGGPCPPCESGKKCLDDGDCTSGVCKDKKCTNPTCYDGVKNGKEVGVDCGPPGCDLCADGNGCALPSDCTSGVCWAGVCQAPACFDGLKNGAEAGVDCGGPCEGCL